MNPPPIPPEITPKNSNSIAHQAAKASSVAGVLTFGVLMILRSNPIGDIIGGMLILGGFVAAIVALAGIPTHGTRGLLTPGILGLLLNGILMMIFIVNFAMAFRKSVVSHDSWNEALSTMNDARKDMKKDFNPKTGVTNINLARIEKVRQSLKNAAENSSGDNAQMAKILSAYMDKMQPVAKNYQAAAVKLRSRNILTQFDPADRGQFGPKREIVKQFMEANTALEQVIANAENTFRADMTQANIADATIEDFLKGFRASSNIAITTRIRQCDDQLGAAMLDALGVLETDWGHWKFDSDTQQINFDDSASREAYGKDLAAIKSVADEQLQLQTKLVNQPRPQP